MSASSSEVEEGVLTASILELASLAEECLACANGLLKSKGKRDSESPPGCHWALFLEKSPSNTSIESCAVSIGGSALLATGEGVESEIVQATARLVARLQRQDGGWTSFSPSQEEESLTVEAFFAVPFLLRAGTVDYAQNIRRGVEWLLSTENPDNGGWGFYAGDSSHVLPTSYAIRIISQWGRSHDEVTLRDAINRGVTWLMDRQNEDGSWSTMPGKPGSAVQTSVALLALIEPGILRRFSKPVTKGRRWLLEHTKNREGVVDNYEVPKRDSEGQIIGFHRRISHVSFPEGVIAQALLACGTDLLDKRLVSVIEALVRDQASDGSWKSTSIAYEKPIFAVLDACLALNSLVLQVKSSERILSLKEDFLTIKDGITRLANMQEGFSRAQEENNRRLSGLESEVNAVKSRGRSQEEALAKMLGFVDGLYILKPLSATGKALRKYPLIALIVVLFLLYTALRVYTALGSFWVDLGAACITCLLLILQAYYHHRGSG